MAFANKRDREDRVPAEPTLEQLIEARERTDAGFRTAFPELAEQLGIGEKQAEPKPKAPVDHETATIVGTKLLDAHRDIAEAAVALPLEGHMDMHLAFNGLLNELNRLTGELAERWSS